MNIDTGMAVVIGAVLIFYLRLIILQRERVKRVAQAVPPPGTKTKKAKTTPPVEKPAYSVLSKKRSDLAIAAAGGLAILFGMAINAQWIPVPAAQPYWWLPTALGIIAFSWAFKL